MIFYKAGLPHDIIGINNIWQNVTLYFNKMSIKNDNKIIFYMY